jgi:hypothetical protein
MKGVGLRWFGVVGGRVDWKLMGVKGVCEIFGLFGLEWCEVVYGMDKVFGDWY